MEKKPIKVVTIGGGSSYTPELMEGFIKRYEELPIKEIWLVDIEDGREKLEISRRNLPFFAGRILRTARRSWRS